MTTPTDAPQPYYGHRFPETEGDVTAMDVVSPYPPEFVEAVKSGPRWATWQELMPWLLEEERKRRGANHSDFDMLHIPDASEAGY